MIVGRKLYIYNVFEDEERQVVKLKLSSEVPNDAGYHLSHNAKFLCIRNYKQYIFVNTSTGNETWSLEHVKKKLEDRIIWIDFVSETELIGVHRKKRDKKIFKLDVSRQNSSGYSIRKDLSFKKFTFDHTGEA